MSDDHQTKPKSPRASKLTYSSSRASRHTNESPSFNNRLHMRPPKASHAFVKNSAQKKQQMMESLRRAAPQLQNEADDEDSREAAGFKPFVATAEAFLSVPNYAQIKRDRTASAMRPHPVSFSLTIIPILNPILNFSFLIRCFTVHRTSTQCRCTH